MALEDIRAGGARTRLAEKLRETILQTTMVTPMTAEEVIGVLGFVTGLAIGARPRKLPNGAAISKRQYREMAIGHLDKGIEISELDTSKSSLILPS